MFEKKICEHRSLAAKYPDQRLSAASKSCRAYSQLSGLPTLLARKSRGGQDLAELDIDLAAITQAGGWKSTRVPLQYAPPAEKFDPTYINVSRVLPGRLWKWTQFLAAYYMQCVGPDSPNYPLYEIIRKSEDGAALHVLPNA
jgi:hypothetical protein